VEALVVFTPLAKGTQAVPILSYPVLQVRGAPVLSQVATKVGLGHYVQSVPTK